MKVFVKGVGEEQLDKRHYVSAGGEGTVYVKGNTAYKLYMKPLFSYTAETYFSVK